jgi:hypothetical protein
MAEKEPKRWTASELRKLDKLLDAGKTVIEIAPILSRSRVAIYARLQRNYRKQRPSPARQSAILGERDMNRLQKFMERDPNDEAARVAYAFGAGKLLPPAGADWRLDAAFSAPEEVPRNSDLGNVLKAGK